MTDVYLSKLHCKKTHQKGFERQPDIFIVSSQRKLLLGVILVLLVSLTCFFLFRQVNRGKGGQNVGYKNKNLKFISLEF